MDFNVYLCGCLDSVLIGFSCTWLGLLGKYCYGCMCGINMYKRYTHKCTLTKTQIIRKHNKNAHILHGMLS